MFEKIQAYLASQLDIPADEITRDTTFESLGVDSLDTVEMVMDLEEQLGVDLELEDKIATVGELVDFVESLREQIGDVLERRRNALLRNLEQHLLRVLDNFVGIVGRVIR